MITVMRIHSNDSGSLRDVLVAIDEQVGTDWTRTYNTMATGAAWAAVPPAGSDWERAEWDDLAHRAGVA